MGRGRREAGAEVSSIEPGSGRGGPMVSGARGSHPGLSNVGPPGLPGAEDGSGTRTCGGSTFPGIGPASGHGDREPRRGDDCLRTRGFHPGLLCPRPFGAHRTRSPGFTPRSIECRPSGASRSRRRLRHPDLRRVEISGHRTSFGAQGSGAPEGRHSIDRGVNPGLREPSGHPALQTAVIFALGASARVPG